MRTLIAIGCLCLGVMNLDKWWSYLIIAYGAFLATGKYNQANHTAKKIADGIKNAHLPFPHSKFLFEAGELRIISLPDREELSPLKYSAVKKLGKDASYYYIFKDENGGYMIPREALGDEEDKFTEFIKEKTGQSFVTKFTPPIVRVVQKIKSGR